MSCGDRQYLTLRYINQITIEYKKIQYNLLESSKLGNSNLVFQT